MQSPPSDETTSQRISSPNDKDKLLDRLIGLWHHQNKLLWGRLQTIAVLQAGIIGGCYALCFGENKYVGPFLAFALAVLGASLSRHLHKLIKCDIEHRYHYSEEIKKLDTELFAKRSGKMPGYKRIKKISKTFRNLNYLIAFITTVYCFFIVGYWVCCGCWMPWR